MFSEQKLGLHLIQIFRKKKFLINEKTVSGKIENKQTPVEQAEHTNDWLYKPAQG